MKLRVYRYEEQHNGKTYWCYYSIKSTVKPLGLKNEELVQEFELTIKER
jgi:hypothetical protein